MLSINEYTKQKSWGYQMDNSQGLDSWKNYSGLRKPDFYDYVVVCSRSRDSDVLEESNFEAALDLLGGESKHVVIERFGHWGCGWFELLMVNPKAITKLKIAYNIYKQLLEYPVLDDSLYDERLNEYYHEYANQVKEDFAKEISNKFNIKYTKKLVDIAYSLQMEEQYRNGQDAALNISDLDTNRRDEFLSCVKEIDYCYKNSKVFKSLKIKLGL